MESEGNELNISVDTNTTKAQTIESLRKGQLFALFTILTTPLLLGGVTEQLVDGSMRMLHVRKESSTILVMEPYSSLIQKNPNFDFSISPANEPKEKPTNNSSIEKCQYSTNATTWYRYDKVTVLSSGYGKYSVVTVPRQNDKITLEIPNEKIIIK